MAKILSYVFLVSQGTLKNNISYKDNFVKHLILLTNNSKIFWGSGSNSRWNICELSVIQLVFVCSKSTMETPEQCVKSVQSSQ